MGEKLVSVLMVNYNHEDTLAETIQSVLNQTYSNFQFIIVDDGSTDRSCAIIESFQDERIELYKREENEHICVATNYGFAKVKGDYLARIDSDDLWYPDKLEKQLLFMEEHPECSVCFTWCDLIDEYGNNINELEKSLLKLYESETLEQEQWLRKFYFEGNCLAHPAVLMKREVLENIGKFTLAYRQLHDFDYWVRIAKQYKIYVIQERLIAVRRFIDKQQTKKNASASSEKNDTRVFNESMDIHAHFFEGMPDKIFLKGFQQDFRYQESHTKEELECEKAFLMCSPLMGWGGLAPAGIERLAELLEEENMRALLKEKFYFTVKDLYSLTEEHLFVDLILKSRYGEMEQYRYRLEEEKRQIELEKQQLQQEVENCKSLISEYANSTSWKITEPLRKMGSIARRIFKR